MKFDYKGNVELKTNLNEFIDFLTKVPDYQLWNYVGFTVEIDPTVDYIHKNVLIRWLDINEGFNDKITLNSLIEFNNNFKLIL